MRKIARVPISKESEWKGGGKGTVAQAAGGRSVWSIRFATKTWTEERKNKELEVRLSHHKTPHASQNVFFVGGF
jgi:hypothetical protein